MSAFYIVKTTSGRVQLSLQEHNFAFQIHDFSVDSFNSIVFGFAYAHIVQIGYSGGQRLIFAYGDEKCDSRRFDEERGRLYIPTAEHCIVKIHDTLHPIFGNCGDYFWFFGELEYFDDRIELIVDWRRIAVI